MLPGFFLKQMGLTDENESVDKKENDDDNFIEGKCTIFTQVESIPLL